MTVTQNNLYLHLHALFLRRMSGQQREFERIWENTRTLFAKGVFRVARENRTVLSLVCEIDSNLYSKFEQIAKMLEVVCRNQQVYRNESLHFTLLPLGAYDELSRNVSRVSCICSEIMSRFHVFDVELYGLNAFSDSVVVQVLDSTGGLSSLAKQIGSRLRDKEILGRGSVGIHDRLWWVTVARFITNDLPVQELSYVIEHWRARSFGRMSVREFQVVRTDKFYSSETTKVLSRVSLTT